MQIDGISRRIHCGVSSGHLILNKFIDSRILLRKSSVYVRFFRRAKGDYDKFKAAERKATFGEWRD